MPSEVRFTRAQKWDLARISAAAVASTVFFTVPMFLVRPHQAPSPIQSRANEPGDITLASLSEPTTPTGSPSEPEATPSAPIDTNVVSVVTATEFAVATTPAIQGTAIVRTRSSKPAQVRARANTPAAPAVTPSLSRRLARFIAGSGKYNVKPFPTVSTSGG
jgi:hypothetical protein